MRKPFKIPTVLALPLIFVVFIGALYFINYFRDYSVQVPEGVTPQDVRITNITENSFTVSWLTNTKTSDFLVWGKANQLENVTGNNPQSFEMIHYITITNLHPETAYSFKIISGGIEFDNAGNLWLTKTAPVQPPPKHSQIISGLVTTESGLPVAKALVLVTGDHLSPLATTTSESGNWFVPLSISRTENLLSYFTVSEQPELTIFVHAGLEGIASANVDADNINPIPPIVIGQAQDFRDKSIVAPPEITRAKINLSANTFQPSGFSTEESEQVEETVAPTPTGTPTPEPMFEKLDKDSSGSFSVITPSKTQQVQANGPSRDLTPVFIAPIMGVSLFLVGVYIGRKIKD